MNRPPVKKIWETIRDERDDLTDYVVHLTRQGDNPAALDRLVQILRSGVIKPTFGLKRLAWRTTTSITVKGPYPAVCFTEQTIAAIVKTMPLVRGRYSGYGIAYHKVDLYACGGRPVLYGTDGILGRLVRQGEPEWQEGKEIYTGGLPTDLQYLYVRYDPVMPGSGRDPCDWTWEREWRIRGNGLVAASGGLPVLLPNDGDNPPRGAIIVEWDKDIPAVNGCLDAITQEGQESGEWASRLRRVVSLETARRKLDPPDNDARYARLETWPS